MIIGLIEVKNDLVRDGEVKAGKTGNIIWLPYDSSPRNFRGDLKISYQNNWGGPEQKIKFGGELNLRGDLKF